MKRTLLQRDDEPVCFSERARQILLSAPLAPFEDKARYGDHMIAGVPADPGFFEQAKPAAVLVPVVARLGGLHVLLTERSSALKRHAGQVAFPGGRLEPGETALDAALRESEEEIGLDQGLVTPLGFLRPYYSGTGYCVQPLVGLVGASATFQPDPGEVARIFELPLSLMLDLSKYQTGTAFLQGRERRFYALDYPDAYIWGVTAGIMRSFAEIF